MKRVEYVDRFVSDVFRTIDDEKWLFRAVSHSHAVSRFAYLLALRRGEDAEIAAVSGLLHDLYAYEHLDYNDHAHLGAVRAAEVLTLLGMFTEAEIDVVRAAVWHHDDLDRTDGPMDEILKDADMLDNSLTRPVDTLKPHEQMRFRAVMSELGIVQCIFNQ